MLFATYGINWSQRSRKAETSKSSSGQCPRAAMLCPFDPVKLQ